MAAESAVGGWTPGGGSSLRPLPNTIPSQTQADTGAPPYYVPEAANDPTSNRYPRTSMHSDDSSGGCGDCMRTTAEWIDDRCCCGCSPTQRSNELCAYVCVACVGGCCGACSKAC
ncbi:hypothetical protein CC85DRAFT_305562 [Cutaneotrichosporon oleaginosum]|uniref:Uncharacterized protein n=1 Tax=Cutaneotrichosporon oleaginosum TaxID=879819 RepID=A0A0J0XCQ8_9TREE|nr:uncharacterized protein CC85DRAFT_305562 [Cutaneotrichosporon oleaginosum]KLT38863.1 hypothetical protein CC85DRAFT_305562 [Cutaneotrichosporon oleaginosum]TXT14294.1 hypothetical protein COLE_00487 [Cutaneotrichosporon oleaginosum]